MHSLAAQQIGKAQKPMLIITLRNTSIAFSSLDAESALFPDVRYGEKINIYPD